MRKPKASVTGPYRTPPPPAVYLPAAAGAAAGCGGVGPDWRPDGPGSPPSPPSISASLSGPWPSSAPPLPAAISLFRGGGAASSAGGCSAGTGGRGGGWGAAAGGEGACSGRRDTASGVMVAGIRGRPAPGPGEQTGSGRSSTLAVRVVVSHSEAADGMSSKEAGRDRLAGGGGEMRPLGWSGATLTAGGTGDSRTACGLDVRDVVDWNGTGGGGGGEGGADTGARRSPPSARPLILSDSAALMKEDSWSWHTFTSPRYM